MRIFNHLSGLLVLVTAVIGFNATAIAQPESSIQSKGDETLAETFNRTFFDSDPNFFRNRSFKRQFDWILGTNGFADNEIQRDSAKVDKLYRAALKRQVSSDPPVRTRDLPNPYETSILSSPDLDPRTRDNELLFERQ